MSKEQRAEVVRDLLADVRAAHAKQDRETVRALYTTLSEMKPAAAFWRKPANMAVSAAVAANNRRAARKVLASLLESDYPRAVHYEFLARACLDLKQCGNATCASARAEALQAEETAAKGGALGKCCESRREATRASAYAGPPTSHISGWTWT
jgi:hypothetical protein